MTVEAFSQVATLLRQLSPDELDQVQARVNVLRQSSNPNRGAAQEEIAEDWILRVVHDMLLTLGVESLHPTMLKQRAPNFRNNIGILLEFLGKAAGPQRIHQQKLLAMAVELLYQDLTQQQLPATAITIVRQIHRVPAILDVHFPGYMRNGFLKLIIRSEVI